MSKFSPVGSTDPLRQYTGLKYQEPEEEKKRKRKRHHDHGKDLEDTVEISPSEEETQAQVARVLPTEDTSKPRRLIDIKA